MGKNSQFSRVKELELIMEITKPIMDSGIDKNWKSEPRPIEDTGMARASIYQGLLSSPKYWEMQEEKPQFVEKELKSLTREWKKSPKNGKMKLRS